MTDATLPAAYFDELYARDADPWHIAHGWYEQRKRALAVALLPDPRYAAAVEVGCGNGDLTVLLAERCDRVVAVEGSARGVEHARARLEPWPHVEVRHGRVPDDWPPEPADLVVVSEIGYYLSVDDLGRAVDRLVAAARPAATVLAVHWRHDAEDYPQTGDEVHERLRVRPELSLVAAYRDDDMRAEVFSLGHQQSVAQRYGVL